MFRHHEYKHRHAERCTQEEVESGEQKEAQRRERMEECGLALRGALIIWDIVSVILH